ncbi:hypothetical protein JOE58_000135 [Curtobacterium luteum]|uniref:Uncharacterized protein n=3 Tax=Curtobacterium TaxID=2034 RepID=A0ABS2RSG7_9MICO|nr:hypothetical protein [Curtobacterium luteum]MBM7800884.1 hypothetical protein [Curtobacterium luteum]NUU49538.1 hypothetical protein [Curtobacterium luteum]
MDWWNELTDWTASDTGWRLLSGAIIPFVAIVVAGIVAALIGRGATKRVVALQEREAKNAAVAAIISAARKAATWGSLGHEERAYADHLAEDADVRLRLLPVSGAPLAANWAQHEIADIKKNSSTFSFQADQSLAEFRDRLLEWQARPNRARKLFKSDLERWKFESPDPDADLVKRQQDWNADQVSNRQAETPQPAPTPTTTSLRAPDRSGGTASAAAGAGSAQASTGNAAQASTGNAAQAGTVDAGAAGGTPAPAGTGTPGSAPARTGAARTDDAPAPATSSAPAWARTAASTGATAATTPLGDGLTRPYGDVPGPNSDVPGRSGAAPVRPTLGSPSSRPASTPATSADRGTDDDETDVVDDAARPGQRDREVPPPVARPTAAEAHVNRPAATVSTPSTKSVSTRLDGAAAEPADAHETDEAPYTQPISANEIRRRSSDDDD